MYKYIWNFDCIEKKIEKALMVSQEKNQIILLINEIYSIHIENLVLMLSSLVQLLLLIACLSNILILLIYLLADDPKDPKNSKNKRKRRSVHKR